MKIVIAAGGSGGHLLPAQQLAEELQKEAEILFAGHRLNTSAFFRRDLFLYHTIPAAPLKLSINGLYNFFITTARGLLESVRLIRSFQPDVVVGFGSFHSFPLLLAAMFMRRKIVLFEANCLIGKVNRFFARYARIVTTQFALPNHRRNLRLVPLLPWKKQSVLIDKANARKSLGLDLDRPTFLVFGGSQGADFLNRVIPASISKDWQVIHLAGNDQAALDVKERYANVGIGAVVKGFDPNMDLLYSAADFAICRSGAGTMAELIRYSLPALLIPFPFASDDHQRINAEFLVKNIQGATMLFEKEANAQAIGQAIDQLIQQSQNYRAALASFLCVADGRKSLKEQILQLGKKI